MLQTHVYCQCFHVSDQHIKHIQAMHIMQLWAGKLGVKLKLIEGICGMAPGIRIREQND